MNGMSAMSGRGLAMIAGALVAGMLGPFPAHAAAPACGPATAANTACTCELNTLRPLQGAIGQDQVNDRAEKIRQNLDKARRDLAEDPIKVVHGPGGALFVTDHHHGASAMMKAGERTGTCQLQPGPAFNTEAEFWAGLATAKLDHLEDENGRPIQPSQLPPSLAAMPNDPYRTFAWRLRHAGGFCRAVATQKEFVEFAWADWMRNRPELPLGAIVSPSQTAINSALALARSRSAHGLPGWVGDRDASFRCPKDD